MPVNFLPKLLSQINLRLNSAQFTLGIALFFVIFCNASFFHAVSGVVSYTTLKGAVFIANIALVLWLCNIIIINLLVLPYIGKLLISFLLFAGAACSYFMDTYSVPIHRVMIQNVFETDAAEAQGLLSKTLFIYLLSLGLLPSLLLLKIDICFASFVTELKRKLIVLVVAILSCAALIMSMSADYASFFRNNKSVRQLANPLNYIYATARYAISTNRITHVSPLGTDAKLSTFGQQQTKPTLFILVVGETARADHFGINGYPRDTTPLLSKQNIINFTQATSCGTETAVSVPCMFSNLGREDYSPSKAKSHEDLLDVVKHAGMNVLWRDNNSSCKGTCNNVTYENMQHLDVPELCNSRECFDDILLYQLENKLSSPKSNQFIVLHQKGSHGPDYYNRYPEAAEFFSPTCKTNQLQSCSTEEIINAFDNTIRQTDSFLNNAIEWLKTKSADYNTSLLYLSDHGESLGENHIYLHGMPYAMAPLAQKHIPLFLWFSEDYADANAIDRQCLRDQNAQDYSHDNLFHTVIGMLNIETSVYNPELDIVKPCKQVSKE